MKTFLAITVLFFSITCAADFGEIDILVKESIERNFTENGYSVDTNRIEYDGEPKVHNDLMTINSSAWGSSGLINKWGWHNCETKINLAPSGPVDLGSRCWLDFD